MATTVCIRPVVGRALRRCNGDNQGANASLASSTAAIEATKCSRLSAIKPCQPRCSSRPFSTSASVQERQSTRDNNRLRGLSSMYRSGFPRRMVVDGVPLPQPAKFKPTVQVDENHGLYQFFYNKNLSLPLPADEGKFGRAWTHEELRHKSWEDLHKLWWVCVKERNRIATAKRERWFLKVNKGEEEGLSREDVVKATMKRIKFVLTERFYTWEDARQAAEADPEIDLSNAEKPYNPSLFYEDEEVPQSARQQEEVEAADPITQGSATHEEVSAQERKENKEKQT